MQSHVLKMKKRFLTVRCALTHANEGKRTSEDITITPSCFLSAFAEPGEVSADVKEALQQRVETDSGAVQFSPLGNGVQRQWEEHAANRASPSINLQPEARRLKHTKN